MPAAALGIGVLSRVSGQTVALVVTLVGARYLAPTEFGVYALAAAIVTIIRTLLYTGTFQYLMQSSDVRDSSTECLAINVLTALTLSILALAGLGLSSSVLGGSAVLTLFLLMAPSNIISAVAAWSEAMVLRSGNTAKYYGATAAGEVFSGLSAIIMLIMGYGTLSFVPMVYVRSIFLLSAYASITAPQLSRKFSAEKSFEIVRWAVPQYAASLTSLFSSYGADFIIGALLSPAATGIYRAASRISGAVSDVVAQPIRLIATTIYSRGRVSGMNIDDLWPRLAALAVFIALPPLGGLVAIADLILPRMFSSSWAQLSTVVSILCIGRLFSSVAGVATPFLIACNQQSRLFPIQLAAGLCLIGGLAGTARGGIPFAALATSASTCFGTCLYMAAAFRIGNSSKMISLKWMLVCALPGTVSSITAYIASKSMTNLDHLTSAGCAIIAACGSWLVVVFLLRKRVIPELKILHI